MPDSIPICNCQSFRVAMVAQPDESYTCPLCRVSVRVAQYGGVGAGNAQWAPGGSPIGQGGSGAGGWGINSKYVDESFEATIGRTHKNPPDDPKRNIEKRLEPFHVYSEEDSIPYNLSQEERKKLRIKKNTWRREHLNQATKQSIDENKPSYINTHFFPKPQQMRTIEQSLESRHLEPKDKNAREDESPALDRPTRIHTSEFFSDPRVAAQFDEEIIRLANDLNFDHGTNRMKGEEEDDYDDNISPEKWRYHHVPMGNAAVLTTGLEVDQHLDDLNKLNYGGNLEDRGGDTGENINATTIQDYPRPDQIGDHSDKNSDPIPSPLIKDEELDIFNSPNVGTEQKLRELNNPKGQRLPQDPYSRIDKNEFEDRNGEPMGVADKYQSFNNLSEPGGVTW